MLPYTLTNKKGEKEVLWTHESFINPEKSKKIREENKSKKGLATNLTVLTTAASVWVDS